MYSECEKSQIREEYLENIKSRPLRASDNQFNAKPSTLQLLIDTQPLISFPKYI